MILSDKSIKAYLKENKLKIDPLVEEHIQGASVDLRLGNEFKILKYWSGTKFLDFESKPEEEKIENVDEIVIPPHSFVLGTTMERIELPPNLTGFIEGRSSVGRMGLFIQTAGLVAPGFKGQITLELYNANILPIVVKARHRICQIVFCEMKEATENSYKGKYQNQAGATTSRLSEDPENKKS